MSKQQQDDQPVGSVNSEDEQLLQAAIDGNLDNMKKALHNGANAGYNKYIELTWGAYDQYSAIHKVLGWKDKSLKQQGVELLLKAGADVNAKYGSANWKGSGSSGTAFQMAMKSGDDEIIRLFLEHGADPNTTETREAHTMRYDGRSSYPVLYLAAQRNNVNLVKCLLDKGALPNAHATNRGQSEYGPIDDTEEIALHAACDNYCSLVANKSNSNFYVDSDEEEADEAIKEKQEQVRKERVQDCEKIVRYLLEVGSDVNAPSRNVEHVSVEREGVSEDDYEVNDPRSDRYIPSTRNVWIISTALHTAIIKKCERLVKLLMAHGADTRIPYQEDKQNTSCLDLTKQQEPFFSLIKNAFYWTPESHEFLPSELRTKIKLLHMCMCSSKCGWNVLNIDLLGLIYTFVCHEYFFEKNAVFEEQRRIEKQKSHRWY
ncbi:hypothetical protein C9374_008705 [Naegleria lovaniensis]|uniref:Ankyrin repeat protein n=1 Tax=Naegleria lovaniensis TaxID=51637 RepID=A0AA88GL02_NAELO|nr:uncharacterized protein C9374_008705 [Naegleria lovaniensis]KAG2378083.1 hypothetical protein C9374_008705 [Naegleria lovaniensis]